MSIIFISLQIVMLFLSLLKMDYGSIVAHPTSAPCIFVQSVIQGLLSQAEFLLWLYKESDT